MLKMRSYVFTHNNFGYPASELPEWDKIKYVAWQHEKVTHDHIQGYVELFKPQRVAACIKWLPGAHFEARKGTPQQAKDYVTKSESRVAGPWERGTFTAQGYRSDIASVRDLIISGGTKRDVLEQFPDVLAKYPRFIDDVVRISAESRTVKILDYIPRYTWQSDLLSLFDKPPSERSIHWIYDPFGNSGKTYLATYLVDSKGAYYTNGGKSVDLAHAYKGEPIVVFDYVREHKDYVGYGIIEQLKNGVLMSTKYESITKRFNKPHVVVFANFSPELDKFSEDRLVLVELDSTHQEKKKVRTFH